MADGVGGEYGGQGKVEEEMERRTEGGKHLGRGSRRELRVEFGGCDGSGTNEIRGRGVKG